MKYFSLASKAYRETVDLRLYEDDIAAAIAKVRPDVDTLLFVEQEGFTLSRNSVSVSPSW